MLCTTRSVIYFLCICWIVLRGCGVGVSQAGPILLVHMLQQNAVHFSSAALLSNLGNVLSVFLLLLKIFYLYVKVSLI
jgi:hypothetical protein